jgi:uncharacterized protein (DUF58 family)
MDLTRRSLLRGATVVAASAPLAALLPADLAFAGAPLTRANFTPYKNSLFTVRGLQFKTKFRLVAIDDLSPSDKGHPRRFSLVFRPVSGRRPGQGTYKFVHPKAGTVSMFVVPTGQSHDYQAVFNAR